MPEDLEFFRDLGEINFPLIFILVVATWLIIILIQNVLPWLADRVPPRFRPPLLSLSPVLRVLILAGVAIEILILILQPGPQSVIAVLGAAGVAIGFAFKDYFGSLIAGVVTIYERPYRPGDWIEFDDAFGEVQAVGLRALRIARPADDSIIVIPHSKLWDTKIHNRSQGRHFHLCVVDFYLHPKHDDAAVSQKLHDVALSSPYVNAAQPISIRVAEKPWATHYRLRAYPLDSRDQGRFRTDLARRGRAALTGMGVEPVTLPAAALADGRA